MLSENWIRIIYKVASGLEAGSELRGLEQRFALIHLTKAFANPPAATLHALL